MQSVFVHHLETAVPVTAHTQAEAAQILQLALAKDDRRVGHLIHRLYTHSGIGKRNSVMGNCLPGTPGNAFYDPLTGTFMSPSTEVRNQIYTDEARRMAPDLAAPKDPSRGYRTGPGCR